MAQHGTQAEDTEMLESCSVCGAELTTDDALVSDGDDLLCAECAGLISLYTEDGDIIYMPEDSTLEDILRVYNLG